MTNNVGSFQTHRNLLKPKFDEPISDPRERQEFVARAEIDNGVLVSWLEAVHTKMPVCDQDCWFEFKDYARVMRALGKRYQTSTPIGPKRHGTWSLAEILIVYFDPGENGKFQVGFPETHDLVCDHPLNADELVELLPDIMEPF